MEWFLKYDKTEFSDSFPETKCSKTYQPLFCFKCSDTKKTRALGWLSRLGVRLWLRSWSCSPWVQAPRQALCWQLRAWSLLQILCLPLSLPLPCLCVLSLSLSLSLKNKQMLKKKKKKEHLSRTVSYLSLRKYYNLNLQVTLDVIVSIFKYSSGLWDATAKHPHSAFLGSRGILILVNH